MSAIGAMFGGLMAWPISDYYGRQSALVVGGVPSLLGWLMVAYAGFVTTSRDAFLFVLLVGRFLTGFATGWSIYCVSVSSYWWSNLVAVPQVSSCVACIILQAPNKEHSK